MLLKTVMFDSTNYFWENDRTTNMMFLRMNENYLNDIIKRKGYIYLNEICERLGMGWNPDDENPCVKYNKARGVGDLEFDVVAQPDNAVLINILYYN